MIKLTPLNQLIVLAIVCVMGVVFLLDQNAQTSSQEILTTEVIKFKITYGFGDDADVYYVDGDDFVYKAEYGFIRIYENGKFKKHLQGNFKYERIYNDE
jgi:hypothetical protein